jgi:hypothetical protein
MKQHRIQTRVATGLTVFVLSLASALAGAGTIVGSNHDFTATTGTNGQICIVCHAPHNTQKSGGVPLVALWNHTQSAATYSMYNAAFSSSVSGAVDTQPSGVSKLCLSCHDGTIAVNSFGGTTGAVTIAASANLGTDLRDDHPIAVVYDAALDGALKPTSTAVTIGSTAVGGKSKVGTIASVLLANGKVECSSCHDVHNTFTLPTGNGQSGTTNMLIKVSMTGSGLCLACHDK